MKYSRHDFGSYKLHIIKTTKFKTVSVIVNFRRSISKEETTIRSFLSLILLNSTNKYPTKRLLNIEAEKLYDLEISPAIKRIGNHGILSFELNMINEKWTETGMYEKSLNYLLDILFDPHVVDNKFDSKSFNLVKRDLITKINNIKDNKKKYAVVKMLEAMDKRGLLPYRFGYLEDVANINEANLYDYYLDVIKSDVVDIFVLGNIDVNQTKKIIQQKIPLNTIKKQKRELEIKHQDFRKRIKKIKEEEDVKQAKMVIGCKLINLTDFEKKYVMPIFSNIFGGAGYSKLFRSVREQKSLAYYINSQYIYADQILITSSGINQESFDKTLQQVRKELQNMLKGNITKEEVENAKNEYINVHQLIEDHPRALINTYLTMELLELDNIKTRIKKIKEVTIDDLKKVSKKIKMDTVYLLYGDDINEEN
ncbi:MAG: insulinase family protein [Bacilli bacterium]|jgi:predicted Zn-dependent peptidase|nr:insulinase family protein [Bacilli bacterium]